MVWVPDEEEDGDVGHLEVEVDGVNEGLGGLDMEAVDPGVGEPATRRLGEVVVGGGCTTGRRRRTPSRRRKRGGRRSRGWTWWARARRG